MKTQKRLEVLLANVAALMLCGAPSCSMRTEAAAKNVFNTYDTVAIWPRLSRVQEELFTPLYMKAFPGQSLIERRDLNSIIGEQDILPDRLDAATRAKIRRIYGVKAIVYPNYTPGRPNQLFLKVIDTETGEIVGSVVIRGEDLWTEQEVSDTWLIRLSVAALRDAAKSCEPS